MIDDRYNSVPMIMAPTPITGSAVETTCAVESIPRSIPAEARAEEDADANRRNEEHRSRPWWWRVVVTRSRSLVRLNHICAGVRACSRSKPECE